MPTDDSSIPNGDPQEDAGPGGSEVSKDEGEISKQEAMSGPNDAPEFGLRDELAEHFPLESIVVGLSPDDGLPTPMDATDAMPLAPKFGPDTLVCIEDERTFVELFAEDDPWQTGVGLPESVDAALYPKEYVARKTRRGEVIQPPAAASGFVALRSRFDEAGEPISPRVFEPSKVVLKWGAQFVQTSEGLLRVAPKRIRCDHYKRMVFANDDTAFKPGEFGHQVLYRNCSARKSVGGAMMSVKDEAVYACDHRMPPDPETVRRYLDEPDRKRSDYKPEMVPLFNLTSKKEK